MYGLLVDDKIIAVLILVATLFFSQVTSLLLKKLIHISSKTNSKLDDIIINMIKNPIKILILVFGFFFAFEFAYPNFSFRGVDIESIFSIIWILAAAFFFSKTVNVLFVLYGEKLQKAHKKIDKTILNFVKKVISLLVYLFALLAILRSFGIEITPMLAGLGIGGLAVALALKDTLANFFAAVYITADQPMKIGDYIEISKDTSGYVHDIGWRTTRIKTWDGNYIIIPNSKISESLLRNYNAPKSELVFGVECGVSYSSDLEKVEKVVVEVAKKLLKNESGGVGDFEPLVRFKEFGDSSINFSTLLKVKTRVDKFKVRSEFIKAIHERFKKENIEIPFPQIDVHNKK